MGYSRPITTVNKGKFIRPCPCSPGRLRCNYFTITPAVGCPFDCSYCFLNFYGPERNITIYANTDDMFKEFHSFMKGRKGAPTRMGTGEFMDSLALKELDDVNAKLAEMTWIYPELILEFKTKSTRIEAFMERKAQKNIVLSWSLNPQSVIDSDENMTSSLKERITCAITAAKHGYGVALHLDPIFMEDDLLGEYASLIDETLSSIPSNSIRWISMGGFRYTDELKLAMLEKSGLGRTFLSGEFVKCSDGKYRYPRYQRAKFYNQIGSRIKSFGNINTYMCMEDHDLWRHIKFGDKRALSLLHS